MRLAVASLLILVGCSKAPAGSDCALDRSCPDGMKCFPDFRCWPLNADPGCDPPCYGQLPFCDKSQLRCVACLDDDACPAGQICVPPVMRCQAGCDQHRPQCADPGSQCDLTLHECRGCMSDQACTDPSAPRCTVETGLCDACRPDAGDCAGIQNCEDVGGRFSCVTGCQSDADCGDAGSGSSCCGQHCVDLSSTPDHCGDCAIACGPNETCCSGQCADLSQDTENCAACGVSCSLPGVSSPRCNNGTCSNSGCEFYYGDCDQNPSNGCETNLSYDPNNCTNCGNKCSAPAHVAPACKLGSCATGGCEAGWGDCNNSLSDGCETPLNTAQNCGRCGVACTTGQCRNGQCG